MLAEQVEGSGADLSRFVPPHSGDAEGCLVGSLLLADPAGQRRMRTAVKGGDFYLPWWRTVWEAAGEVLDSGKPLDVETLCEALRDRGRLAAIGGLGELAQAIATVPTADHADTYAARVVELAQRREAIRSLRHTLVTLERDGDAAEVSEAIRRVAGDLMGVLNRRSSLRVMSLEAILHQWVEDREAGRQPAQLTGIDELDQFVGVFRYGGYTIVGGRPSQGKSTFIRWLLGVMAGAGLPVGLVACEEDRTKIAGNYISAATSIENDKVAYGALSGQDWQHITSGVGRLARNKMHVCDDAFNLDQVCAAAETMVIEHGCKVLAIDHIHLIQHGRSRSGKSGWTRNDQITEMSAALKELGRRHNVVLIVAAQLSRPEEKKGVPNPPQLTDLRESGSLEQDADAVLMLHREDYYRRSETPTGEARIGIEKNRNGKVGAVTLKAELKFQRFAQLPPVDAAFM